MKTFTFAGGVLGLVVFLFVGLLPAVVYGGFAGVVLSSAILSTPIAGSILAKTIVVFGMVVGLLGTAGVFTVLGAVFGTGVGTLTKAITKDPGHEAHNHKAKQ